MTENDKLVNHEDNKKFESGDWTSIKEKSRFGCTDLLFLVSETNNYIDFPFLNYFLNKSWRL